MKAVSARTPMRIPKTPLRRQVEHCNDIVKARDPVSVYCRVRPLQSDSDLSCLRVKSSTTIALNSSDVMTSHKQVAQREIQYFFKHVFQSDSTQQDIFIAVAQPLVENLLRGRNSLLFTYGVTGSGKTYTMTGDLRHRGIMPRCLDVLFRTISDYQAKKFVFKPDRLNGFEILTEADALIERQTEMNQRFVSGGRGHIRRKDSDPEIASQASVEFAPLQGLEEDNMFAVFVTYIEVYNNSVYDLLEDGGIQKTLQSKIIREDSNHQMFVHGVTEIEVKTVEEALEAFQMGQKRKRMGHTVLNAESSRSHSVFNIRLVQAPTDSQGEHVIQDKRTITVSQLSLVDLAGSERSSRTKNTGARLREAGNINNSLMTLRTCLEYLRENQQAGISVAPKKIPYRDSKITHMFKNYFDGEGQVSMIVCINPRVEDYDENMQVMKFAEMTQEVQITRATPINTDIGLTPGRRKANKLFKIAVNNLNDLGHSEVKQFDIDVGLVYSLGQGFPDYKIDSAEAESTVHELMQYLVHRIEKRKKLRNKLENQCDAFRQYIMNMEKENLQLRTEVGSLKAVYNQERAHSHSLENKVRVLESSFDVLNNKLSSRERQIDEITRKLNDKENLLTIKEHEKEKQKKKFNSKLAVEIDRRDRELEIKLREQRAKLQENMRIKDEKLRLVSNIIQSEEIRPNLALAPSSENIREYKKDLKMAGPGRTEIPSRDDIYSTARHIRGVAVANNRHRRSRSAGDKWLEHRAPNPVPLGTIMQPYLKNRKSITKLTDMKDLTGHNATKYCLVSQDADTDGDIETKLYKGNVIPTCGGGAQVVFNDVECLKQKSPVHSPNRKRPNNSNLMNGFGTFSADIDATSNQHSNITSLQDIASRCNLGIEGHANKKSKI